MPKTLFGFKDHQGSNFGPPVFLGNSQGPLCTKAYTETHIFPTCEKPSCPDKNRVGLVDQNKTHLTATEPWKSWGFKGNHPQMAARFILIQVSELF